MRRSATLAMLIASASISLAACANPDAQSPQGGATQPQNYGDPSPQSGATRASSTPAPSPGATRSDSSSNGTGNGGVAGDVAKPGDHPATATGPANPPPIAPPATGDRATTATTPDADNTRINARDRNGATTTPMDQGNNATDLKITQMIRKAVMADAALSFTAKNVKIITNGAKVVLRGPVKTELERISVEAKARATTGVTDVINLLDVKP